MITYLERRDPEQNIARFYAISLAPTLFGPCALVREWGRIGSPGTVREEWFDNLDAAEAAAIKLRAMKRSRGYELPANLGLIVPLCAINVARRAG